MAEDREQFGANAWLVEEMYEQFRANPQSVGETWRDFFADYRPMTARWRRPGATAPRAAAPITAPSAAAPSMAAPSTPAAPAAAPAAPVAPATSAVPSVPAAAPEEELGEPIRGAGAAIVANMERSLHVPDGDELPQRPGPPARGEPLGHQRLPRRSGKGKVSFTHLIGYAIIRAIADAVPAMNNTYVEGADGKPRIVRNPHVNLGLAVDVAKSDGSRTLVVPVVRGADTRRSRSSSPPTKTSSAR